MKILPKIFSSTEKKTLKKVILCEMKKCPFGLKKIDRQCNLCSHQRVIGISGEINPIFAEITEEYEFECYKNIKMLMHQECIHGFKKASMKCVGCARLKTIPINTETKIINKF